MVNGYNDITMPTVLQLWLAEGHRIGDQRRPMDQMVTEGLYSLLLNSGNDVVTLYRGLVIIRYWVRILPTVLSAVNGICRTTEKDFSTHGTNLAISAAGISPLPVDWECEDCQQ